jgi:hypothetical protein
VYGGGPGEPLALSQSAMEQIRDRGVLKKIDRNRIAFEE